MNLFKDLQVLQDTQAIKKTTTIIPVSSINLISYKIIISPLHLTKFNA